MVAILNVSDHTGVRLSANVPGTWSSPGCLFVTRDLYKCFIILHWKKLLNVSNDCWDWIRASHCYNQQESLCPSPAPFSCDQQLVLYQSSKFWQADIQEEAVSVNTVTACLVVEYWVLMFNTLGQRVYNWWSIGRSLSNLWVDDLKCVTHLYLNSSCHTITSPPL